MEQNDQYFWLPRITHVPDDVEIWKEFMASLKKGELTSAVVNEFLRQSTRY